MPKVRGARRKQIAARNRVRLQAAEKFTSVWWELLGTLPDHYNCYMTCTEAEVAATLLRAFGQDESADHVMEGHAEDDECGERHHVPCDECRNSEGA